MHSEIKDLLVKAAKIEINNVKPNLEKEFQRIIEDVAVRGCYGSSIHTDNKITSYIDWLRGVAMSISSRFVNILSTIPVAPADLLEIRNIINDAILEEEKLFYDDFSKLCTKINTDKTRCDNYANRIKEKTTELIDNCYTDVEIEIRKRVLTENSSIKSDTGNKSQEKEYNILKEEFKYEGAITDSKHYKCFVIMPIGEEGTPERKNNILVYNNIIKPCVENSGYKIDCYYADLIDKTGAIPKQIFEALENDDIVIADLRRNNRNVLYELGIRHTFRMRSILVCSDHSENLFHTTTYRALPYKIDGLSNKEFHRKLSAYIDDIIKNPKKSDNPVTDALGVNKGNEKEENGNESRESLLAKLRNIDLPSRKVQFDYSEEYKYLISSVEPLSSNNSLVPFTSEFQSTMESILKKLEMPSISRVTRPGYHVLLNEPQKYQLILDKFGGLRLISLISNTNRKDVIIVSNLKKHLERFLRLAKLIYNEVKYNKDIFITMDIYPPALTGLVNDPDFIAKENIAYSREPRIYYEKVLSNAELSEEKNDLIVKDFLNNICQFFGHVETSALPF